MSAKLHENMNVKVHGTLESGPFVVAAIPAFNEQENRASLKVSKA